MRRKSQATDLCRPKRSQGHPPGDAEALLRGRKSYWTACAASTRLLSCAAAQALPEGLYYGAGCSGQASASGGYALKVCVGQPFGRHEAAVIGRRLHLTSCAQINSQELASVLVEHIRMDAVTVLPISEMTKPANLPLC